MAKFALQIFFVLPPHIIFLFLAFFLSEIEGQTIFVFIMMTRFLN
jgi:hypothetical protein